MFHFEGTKIYSRTGRDVGAEYDVDLLIRGDVYVYPVGAYGKDLKSEARHQQNDITQINKNVRLISQGSFSSTIAGQTRTGFRAEYQLTRPLFADASRRCGSQFYLFQDGSWFFAYRFSYPIEKANIAGQHINNFLKQWQWRARAEVALSPFRPTHGGI